MAVLLWAGAIALILRLAGLGERDTGQRLALLGTTGFASIWRAFQSNGTEFNTWFSQIEVQNTRAQTILWVLQRPSWRKAKATPGQAPRLLQLKGA